MAKASSYYVKTLKQPSRKHQVSSLNLEKYQVKTLKKHKINVSELVRDLLDEYIQENLPKDWAEIKRSR